MLRKSERRLPRTGFVVDSYSIRVQYIGRAVKADSIKSYIIGQLQTLMLLSQGYVKPRGFPEEALWASYCL